MRGLRISAMVLLGLVSLNALVAGFLFMIDPSGARLGLSVELLKFTAFSSFFIPGLVLFSINGLFALLTLWALFRFWPFCAFLLCCQGLLLSGWILLQIIMMREFNPLQGSLLVIGMFFILAGVLLLRQSDGKLR